VFTIIVQSAVAPRMLGAATSSLTFFRQVGGTVGLAIAGTIFGSSFTSEIPRQLGAQGVPRPLIDGFARVDPAAQGNLTNVGVDLGEQILSSVPAPARPMIEPFIGQIVDGIHQAFSMSIGNTMWIAVVAAIAASAIVALVVPELTLRRTTGPGVERSDGTPAGVPVME
jgi:hypothetical protein